MFEQIDLDEYEKRQELRKNDDFIVDDEGYGYTDRGGEIWEYEDHHQAGKNSKGKKQRKTNVQVSFNRSIFELILSLFWRRTTKTLTSSCSLRALLPRTRGRLYRAS